MRLLDLTLPIRGGMAVHPGDPPVRVRQVHDLATHGWRLQEISLGSHTGTHVNAPWHMAQSGARLEELPLASFAARAVVRTVPGAGLDAAPGRGRSVPGEASTGAASVDRLPGNGPARGQGAVSTSPIPSGLGLVYAHAPLDAAELSLVLAARPPFIAQSAEFPLDEGLERELCLAGIVSFENLANTRQLPLGETFLFLGLPLAVGGDGAPARAVALLEDREPAS